MIEDGLIPSSTDMTCHARQTYLPIAIVAGILGTLDTLKDPHPAEIWWWRPYGLHLDDKADFIWIRAWPTLSQLPTGKVPSSFCRLVTRSWRPGNLRLVRRSTCLHCCSSGNAPALKHGVVIALQAQDGLMQYGAFGGMSPYAMVADGASIRASSAPAYDLTPAHPQYHPVGVDSQGPPTHPYEHPVTCMIM